MHGPPNVWDRIIRADRHRKTRFHDESGHLVAFSQLRYAPASMLSQALRMGLRLRPQLPWIPYPAIERLQHILSPTSKVMEFGSGMSTVWLAQRAAMVCSVEDNPAWQRLVRDELQRRGLANFELILQAPDEYGRDIKHPDASFDVALVDGIERARCIALALRKVRPGGWIYLDNSDKTCGSASAVGAVELLERAGNPQRIRSFLPGTFFVVEGILAQV
jgi:hypothetical protein